MRLLSPGGRRWLAATLCGVLLGASSGVRALPDFPAPPRSQVKWVSKDMVINGIATEVRQFYSKWNMEKIAEFYRKEWQYLDGRKPGFTESNAMAPWHLITRIEDGYLMNAQYQQADDGGTWGYLSISKLPPKDAKPNPRDKPPAMRRSHVMSSVKTEDPGQSGRSFVLRNDYSLSTNVDFYRNYYKRRGYGVQADRTLKEGNVHALAFRNRLREVTIVITGDHQESQVVFNEVNHELF